MVRVRGRSPGTTSGRVSGSSSGSACRSVPRLDDAELIVSLDDDLLGDHPVRGARTPATSPPGAGPTTAG